MKPIHPIISSIALAAFLVSSCVHRPVDPTWQDSASSPPKRGNVLVMAEPSDPAMHALIAPYKVKVDEWRAPIAFSPDGMKVQRQENPLTSWVADALLEQANRLSPLPVHVSLLNGGGIRADLPPGEVSYLTISSILPFENYVTYLDLNGAQMLELAAVCTSQKGRAIISGWRLEADAEGNLLRAFIDDAPIDPAATYRLATVDFLAMGNGGFDLMKDWPSEISTVLLRDAVTDHVRRLAADGKQVVPPENPWRQFYAGKNVSEL